MPSSAWRGLLELAILLVGVPFLGLLAAGLVGFDPRDGIDGGELLRIKAVEVPLSLLLLAGLLRLAGWRLADLGWRFPRGTRRADALAGLALAPLLWLTAALVSGLLQSAGYEARVPFVLEGIGGVLAALLVGVLAGGVVEELLYRGYVYHRLRSLLPAGRPMATVQAAVLTSLAFALPHGYEGSAAVGAIFALALLLQWACLRRGGRLLTAMVAHAVFNAVQIGLLTASLAPPSV